jgi:hypothetical protein
MCAVRVRVKFDWIRFGREGLIVEWNAPWDKPGRIQSKINLNANAHNGVCTPKVLTVAALRPRGGGVCALAVGVNQPRSRLSYTRSVKV